MVRVEPTSSVPDARVAVAGTPLPPPKPAPPNSELPKLMGERDCRNWRRAMPAACERWLETVLPPRPQEIADDHDDPDLQHQAEHGSEPPPSPPMKPWPNRLPSKPAPRKPANMPPEEARRLKKPPAGDASARAVRTCCPTDRLGHAAFNGSRTGRRCGRWRRGEKVGEPRLPMPTPARGAAAASAAAARRLSPRRHRPQRRPARDPSNAA